VRSHFGYLSLAPLASLAVFSGGGLGSLIRTALSSLTVQSPGSWPWATFSVNIVGAFMVGYGTQ
jgi:CrcB protein